MAGDDAIPLLGRLLNGRKWWGGRQAPALRACAARALAVIGTPAARVALQKAAADKAAPVKSAVRVALKSMDSDEDERLQVGALPDEDEGETVEDPVELTVDVEDAGDKGGAS